MSVVLAVALYAMFSTKKFRSFRKLFILLILTTLVLVPVSFFYLPHLNQQGGAFYPLRFRKLLNSPAASPVLEVKLPVLVFACNRVGVSVHIEQLMKYRPKHDREGAYPIIVSLDQCDNTKAVKDAILTFRNRNVTLIEQPDARPVKEITEDWQIGYHKIARHYKFALDKIFMTLNHSAVIITEDDLNIAPDFFEYFTALYPLLVNDPTLWCISAWNENGREELILKDRPDLLHRSDFFPGLGWMLTRDLWLELRVKWPPAFWDDWMRQPEQRKGRECIRPEISRTTTFGEEGVSGGMFFRKYHSSICLNTELTNFTQFDLSYLEKDRYDKEFLKKVYDPSHDSISYYELVNMDENFRTNSSSALRVSYADRSTFIAIAKHLNIVDDFKYGVMRMAYRGVISVAYKGRRLYITPVQAEQWTHYEPWE